MNKSAILRKMKLVLIDYLFFSAVYFFSVVISKYSSTAHHLALPGYLGYFFLCVVISFLMRAALRVYSNVWRYANAMAFLQMVVADAAGCLLSILISYLIPAIYVGFWQAIAIFTMFNVATLTIRFLYQIRYRNSNIEKKDLHKIGVAIVGAGQIGTLLADELNFNERSHYRPICFIDRDPQKVGGIVSGLKVYPEGEEVIEIIRNLPVQEIFLALPKIDGDTVKALHDFYSRTGCKVKVYDFPVKEDESEEQGKRALREVRIEDLLFRDSLKINTEKTRSFYQGKVVLVTGGGGSIGSELCRQIAKCHPKKLIIFDIYENNAYEIQQELIRKYGDRLSLETEIGSVRDRKRLEAVFRRYHPEIVFHAAAHKHVPLMEHSNCEAIKNNIIGTYNTADMAEEFGSEKFILISTDKAVNPTNIMGASKRMCEMVIQCRNDSKTSFAAVRFGNVLGSNGSVIPLFRKQIEKGGPVTITDKRIIRYFMTIPEASQLVMEAGAMAKRGELYVLDMGKPVRILDLAENMIRLSGLRPYVDIDIQEIGLRPGEKLFEELLIKTENLDKTDNDIIFIERDTPYSREEMEEKLAVLNQAVKETELDIASPKIKEAMKRVVPTYKDPEEVNKTAAESEEMKEASVAGKAC